MLSHILVAITTKILQKPRLLTNKQPRLTIQTVLNYSYLHDSPKKKKKNKKKDKKPYHYL